MKQKVVMKQKKRNNRPGPFSNKKSKSDNMSTSRLTNRWAGVARQLKNKTRPPTELASIKKQRPKLTYDQLIKQHLHLLKNLQYTSGLFAASHKQVGTGYDKAWLRDNFYECLAFEILS